MVGMGRGVCGVGGLGEEGGGVGVGLGVGEGWDVDHRTT